MLLLLGLLLAALAAGACSSDDGGEATEEATATSEATATPEAATTAEATATTGGGGSGASTERSVAVDLNDEWQVLPSAESVPAGTVTFVAKNVGQQPHQLTVIRTEHGPNDLPAEGGTVPLFGDTWDTLGNVVDLNPGQSLPLTLDLEAGSYLLICNVPGHYQLGMTATFTAN
jgi:uncharacterized cupredoxin-like copper-binding protein